MIDINLLGKKPKTKLEGPSILSQLGRTKIGIYVGSAVLFLGLYWIFGDTIVGMMYTTPTPTINTHQARLDSLKRVLAERQLATQQEQPITQTPEPEPVQEPEPEPVVLPWDYGLSITQIEAFTTLIHALPKTTDYNIIVISRNGIVAELIEIDADVLVGLQSTILNALPDYTFDFRPTESTLQIWGNRKNNVIMSDISPSADYSTPDANLSALNVISQESNVTISERGNTVPTVRNNISLLPIWIKLQGTETNILRYLDSIREKRLNLNITKISSSGLHRDQNGESSVLNFHFEILM